WPSLDEVPGPTCWCGRPGCLETWISGPGLSRDHQHPTGPALSGEQIVARAAQGDDEAQATLDRHASRVARALANVINIFDPEVIVLGGGLSKLQHLYQVLPELTGPHVFSDHPRVDVR